MAKPWYEIDPKDAVNIVLPDPEVTEAPLDSEGKPCPWPWEPQQLGGQPIGMYHCRYCGEMVLAGVRHPDYRDYREMDGPDE